MGIRVLYNVKEESDFNFNLFPSCISLRGGYYSIHAYFHYGIVGASQNTLMCKLLHPET